MEAKFKPGDYIINRASGDIAIIDKITKKNYYHFKEYYGSMFNELNDTKNPLYDLQVNYQTLFDLCTEDEKKKLDDIIEKRKKVDK